MSFFSVLQANWNWAIRELGKVGIGRIGNWAKWELGELGIGRYENWATWEDTRNSTTGPINKTIAVTL